MSAQNETTTIRIKSSSKVKLKVIAAHRDITMQQLIDEMLGLYSAKTGKPKTN